MTYAKILLEQSLENYLKDVYQALSYQACKCMAGVLDIGLQPPHNFTGCRLTLLGIAMHSQASHVQIYAQKAHELLTLLTEL